MTDPGPGEHSETGRGASRATQAGWAHPPSCVTQHSTESVFTALITERPPCSLQPLPPALPLDRPGDLSAPWHQAPAASQPAGLHNIDPHTLREPPMTVTRPYYEAQVYT